MLLLVSVFSWRRSRSWVALINDFSAVLIHVSHLLLRWGCRSIQRCPRLFIAGYYTHSSRRGCMAHLWPCIMLRSDACLASILLWHHAGLSSVLRHMWHIGSHAVTSARRICRRRRLSIYGRCWLTRGTRRRWWHFISRLRRLIYRGGRRLHISYLWPTELWSRHRVPIRVHVLY